MKELEGDLLKLFKEKKDQTADQIIQLIMENYSLDKELILKTIKKLFKEGKIELKEPIHAEASPQSLKEFIFHSMNYDLWLCVLLVIITIPIALFIPENAFESGDGLSIFFGVVRLIIGTIFVVFLPGYAVFTMLWPTSEKEDLTRFGIAFGLSLVIVPILGLILNFTPLGLTFISILIIITLFTLIILCITFIRRYQEIIQKNN
ncbi:MAG: DUF1616 domain-containing protein [Promethearchaeota archaeon]